ncbi:PilN domain-containing protein [Botrimarina hoheduenensis]|uniref:Fimbrial assembly protein (PilN) n=1 Tax=Botrimarina hoheduenensis TaxID=2528000 RepID=A0A5C5VPV9_9BACT|nr:PilN domain-containing protein [Botrimarina hoheduenensis]TWT40150.1 Fimbrial assembly protein (PilN) [Botrimarina hoheduenensis]
MKRVLNLAPPGIRRRQTLRRLRHAVATAVTAAGVLSGLWLVVEWSRGASMAQSLGRLEAEYAPLARLMEEDVELRAEIARLRGREQLSLRLTTEQLGLSLLAAVSRAAAMPEAQVYLDQLHYRSTHAKSSVRQRGATEHSGVKIEGISRDGLAVARFAEGLRESRLFSQVSIETSAPAASDGSALRKFTIACAF